MKWDDYYDRFWGYAESTQISKISSLTDFSSSAEVAEIANEFYDDTIASRLVNRAMQNGIRFTPAEIIELSGCVTERTLSEAIRNRLGRFSGDEFKQLEGLCHDEQLLENVAKADGIKRETWDVSFQVAASVTKPVKAPSLLSMLLGIGSSSSTKSPHSGCCTGDCAHCPAHYGYRYGRWYYGHHHTHGCEFGGNDGGGKP